MKDLTDVLGSLTKNLQDVAHIAKTTIDGIGEENFDEDQLKEIMDSLGTVDELIKKAPEAMRQAEKAINTKR